MGPVKSVGEKTVSIGIASWGTIHNRKSLSKIGETIDCDLSSWFIVESARKDEIYLGKNHTHFLFVDDGHINKFGEEIHFRKKLEDELTLNFYSKCKLKINALHTTTILRFNVNQTFYSLSMQTKTTTKKENGNFESCLSNILTSKVSYIHY